MKGNPGDRDEDPQGPDQHGPHEIARVVSAYQKSVRGKDNPVHRLKEREQNKDRDAENLDDLGAAGE